MTLSLDLGWSLDPSGGVSLSAAKATWGVMPGVSLQAGSGVGIFTPGITGSTTADGMWIETVAFDAVEVKG